MKGVSAGHLLKPYKPGSVQCLVEGVGRAPLECSVCSCLILPHVPIVQEQWDASEVYQMLGKL